MALETQNAELEVNEQTATEQQVEQAEQPTSDDGTAENLSAIEQFLAQPNAEASGQASEGEQEPTNSEEEGENHPEEPSDEAKEQSQSAKGGVTVTEEMAKDFPELKSLVGKPITEVAKSYSELLKEFTKTRQELAELKKKPSKETDERLIPEEASPDDEGELEYIDPIEDPEGFLAQVKEIEKKTLAKEIEQAKKELEEKLRKEFEEKLRVQEQVRREQAEFLRKVEQALPEGVAPEVAMQAFYKTFKDPEKAVAFYQSNPDKYIRDLAEFVNASAQNQQIKSAKVNASKPIRHSQSNLQNAQGSDLASTLLQLNYKREDWE